MNRATFLVTRSSIMGDPDELSGLSDFEIAKQFKLGNPADFAGRTDPQIAQRLIEFVEGVPASLERVDLLVDHYVKGLELFIPDHPYTALGDTEGCVAKLNELGAVVGLGTGNVVAGAKLKLESSGILKYFDLALGGYGDDGETRGQLLEAGARRCDPSRDKTVVVVGDTPRDVKAAHEIGAVCVGVPFMANTAQILLDCGADAIVDEVGPGLVAIISDLCAP